MILLAVLTIFVRLLLLLTPYVSIPACDVVRDYSHSVITLPNH